MIIKPALADRFKARCFACFDALARWHVPPLATICISRIDATA